MTGCKLLAALLAVLAAFTPGASAVRAEEPAVYAAGSVAPGDPFAVIDGALVVYARGGAVRLPSAGMVLAAAGGEDGLYYVRASGDAIAGGPVYACMLSYGGGALVEKYVFDGEAGTRIVRLAGARGTLYVLAGRPENGPCTLYSVSMNSGGAASVPGVLDFGLAGDRAVLLEREEDLLSINNNGSRLSLSIRGDASIGQIVAGRILFVMSAGETEVLDLALMRSLYRYSDTARYLKPDEWNLLIEAVDVNADAAAGNMVFYKVFVDDAEEGRTDTGNPAVSRVMQLDLEPDCLHIVRMERWELNIGRGKYERANNIRQPAPVKLFLPGWMVMRLSVSFDGKAYATGTEILIEK